MVSEETPCHGTRRASQEGKGIKHGAQEPGERQREGDVEGFPEE